MRNARIRRVVGKPSPGGLLLWPCLGVLLGCGARSGLDSSLSPGAELDATVPVIDAAAPTSIACTNALAAGAPAALVGYCSTRTNSAPNAAPSAPQIVWSAALPVTTAEDPGEVFIDSKGTTYVAVQTSAAVSGYGVTAFSPDGSILWSNTSFAAGTPESFFLAADGKLHVALAGTALEVLGDDGAIEATYPLPVQVVSGEFAVGHDGSLYGFVDDQNYDHYVAKLTPTGGLVWRSAAQDCTEAAVLTPDDHVIAFSCDSDGGLSELDSNGGTAWTAPIAGYLGGNPGVALDGTLRVAVSLPGDEAPPRLVSVDPSGNVLWNTVLPWSLPMSLAIARDGTTAVALNSSGSAGGGIVAVSPEGNVLWQMTLEATDNAGFQMAVDRAGTLVVTTSFTTLAAFDVETGDPQWSLGSPSDTGPAGPFAIGADGTIMAVGALPSDGHSSPPGLFLLRDP